MAVTTHQIATRKLGAVGPEVSAIGPGCMGMSDVYGLAEMLGAPDIVLSGKEIAGIARAIPPDAVTGGRYAPAQMKMIDSEKQRARA